MINLQNIIRNKVRSFMRQIAMYINNSSGGKISPNMITFVGLFMHLPIAWLISQGYFGYGAIGLIIFGLFDALDGELARIQNKSSPAGMFIDSTTDRMKEILIYTGLANVYITSGASKTSLIILTATLGISILTSYMNAWGEVVLANFSKSKSHKINNTFRSGLLSFDMRMFIIIVGLVSGYITGAILVIFVFGIVTVMQRYINITRSLSNVQS